MLHLNARLSLNVRDSVLPFRCAQTLVTGLVRPLELHVSGRARTHENSDPVLDRISLSKWPVAVGLGKFMRIQILSCRFTPANQEEMVCPQRCRVGPSHRAVNHHGPGDPENTNRITKGEMVAVLIHQNVRQAGTE